MNSKIEQLISNIERVIIGKRPVIEQVICAMLAGGHVLIEDVPGVGKTLLAETLAKSVSRQLWQNPVHAGPHAVGRCGIHGGGYEFRKE